MSMQLKIYDIERVTKIPTKFRFPMFNKVIWLSAIYYANHRDEFDNDIEDKNGSEILNAWLQHLSQHFDLSKTNQAAKRSIPTQINPGEFLKTLRAWKEQSM